MARLATSTAGRHLPPAPARARPEVGGIPIDLVDMDGAVQRCVTAARSRSSLQVCTVNLDFLVNARRDGAIRSILRESGLNLVDGAPVGWLAQLAGHARAARVAGSDLVPALMRRAAEEELRVFLLGGEDGVGERAAAALLRTYPQLQIAGIYEPARTALEQIDDEAILQRVSRSRADILLVALGHPKQEKWIHDHLVDLPVPVAIGVGCTFDLLAGRRSRAPKWMQDHGLEWLHRAVHEPWRLGRRYLRDGWTLTTVFAPAALRERHQRPSEVKAP